MENASKALLIAGGILLAMMILALLVYVGTSMSDMEGAQNRKREAQQLENFNKTYEAYNKTRMYGTDVITVVNKAIDYNTKLDTDEENYYINIIIIPKETFETTEQIITTYSTGEVKEGEIKKISSYGVLEKDKEYKLLRGSKENPTIDINVLNFFSATPTEDNNEDVTEESEKNKLIKIKYTYSAITNFKRAIFQCTDVSYENGRIKSMTFSQL